MTSKEREYNRLLAECERAVAMGRRLRTSARANALADAVEVESAGAAGRDRPSRKDRLAWYDSQYNADRMSGPPPGNPRDW